MPHHEVDRLIGRAIADTLFREELLESPGVAILEFPFTSDERNAIASIEAGSLEDFAQQLIERMKTYPNGHQKPNGSAPSRGPWDGLAESPEALERRWSQAVPASEASGTTEGS